VTVVSLKTEEIQGSGLVKVEFSNGTSLLCATDYLSEDQFPESKNSVAQWEAGKELSAEEVEAFQFASLCYRAEKIALGLIARAEQNSLGLAAKLERRGYDAAVVKMVVSQLLKRNLLDDGRYAELWIRSRLALRKAPSPRWLLVSLVKRGIDRASALRALTGALDPETEYTLLLKFLEKQAVSEGKNARSLRNQLKYEGFSVDTLRKYFND